MDLPLLAHLARQLEDQWAGAWVQQAWQDVRGRVVLRLRRPAPEAATGFLLLSPLPEAQGFGLLPDRPPVPPRPPALAAYLRAHLVGGRLERAALLGGDRVVEFLFVARAQPLRLILEATGRRGNLVVVDGGGAARAAWQWQPADTHPLRPLVPGGPYAPPPPPRSPRPLSESPPEPAGLADAGCRLEEELRREAGADAAAACEARVSRERRRLEARAEKIRVDLGRLPDPGALRRLGDALGAGLARVARGDRAARVADPTNPEVWLTIDLDPSLGAGENLNRLYERARKVERGRVALEERLRSTLEELGSVGELTLAPRGRTAGEPTGEAGPFRRLQARNGWPLWVGRNGRENDRLLREARPWDLWFHAADSPGAHVLLRLPGRDAKVPDEVLREAARLAAVHSRRAGEAAVDVLVAEAGRVRKPKGASPGRVVVAGERVLRVRPDAGGA